MGPPCPNCGMTLTWFAQNSAWGCDRCRVMHSPQQLLQPTPQPPQQPQYQPPQQQPPPQQYQQPPQPQYQQPPPQQPGYQQPQPGYQQPPLQQPQPFQQQGFPPQSQHPQHPVIPKTIPLDTFRQQQQTYPQAPQGFGQPPAMSAPVATPKAKASGGSNKVLIAAGVGVVIAAGAAIAIVMTRGGGSSIGVSSRDQLVKLTYSSLAAGDVDGLMKRSGMPGLKKYVKCEKDAIESPEEEAKHLAETRDEVLRAAARLKGASIKVGKITAPEKPETMAKGETMGTGCKLEAAFESHNLTVKLEILHANGTSETQAAEMRVGKVDGQWIFSGAPKIPGCTAAVAQIALHGSMETKADDTVNGLQPVLMARCLEDAWGPTVLKCLEGSSGIQDAQKCFAALTPKELAPLIKEVDAALAAAPSTAKELRAMLPDEAEAPKPAVADTPPPPTTPVDPDAALVEDTLVLDVAPPDPNADDPGKPEQGEQADFWLWTRGDGAVRVTSPVVKAVFPGRPEQKLEKGSGKTMDGKDVWLYQFIYDLGDDGQLRLELSALGRNASQSDKEPLVPMMAKIGKVKRKKTVVDGVSIVDLEAFEASSGGSLRTHAIRDMKRGLMIVGVAATSPKTRAVGTKFLASVAEVLGADPTEDPQVLADIIAKKVKKKYVTSTANGDFSIELPSEPKITRTGPQPGKSLVLASIIAETKKSQISLQLSEHASWDALTFHPIKQEELANEMKAALEKQTGATLKMTPGRLAGMTGYSIDMVEASKPKVQFRMLFNRYQHRTIMLFCIDASCDAAVDSIKFAEPAAE